MEQKIYYKAAFVWKDKILPCVHSFIGVEYQLGEWTYPLFPGSSLFCCPDLESAKGWASNFYSQVFSCEVEIEPNPIFKYHNNIVSDSIKNFWESLKDADDFTKYEANELHCLKENSQKDYEKYVFCKKIKLLEKVT